MVWMIPSAENAKFAVITLMTYLIAIGGFTHIVAGSIEAHMLVLNGEWEWWQMLGRFWCRCCSATQSLFFAGADFGQSAARTDKDYTNLFLQERGR